jgi:hypothetical protein
VDWIPFRFLKNESLGYYEDLTCDFQDKSIRARMINLFVMGTSLRVLVSIHLPLYLNQVVFFFPVLPASVVSRDLNELGLYLKF